MASSSFTLPQSDPPCSVHLGADLSQDQLLGFPAFKTWSRTIQHSLSLQQSKDHEFHSAPYRLRDITVGSVNWFGSGESKRPGFIMLQASVSNDKGEALPGAVLLRGGSVAMLLVLQPDDVSSGLDDECHVLLTIQPRIPAGSLRFAELPAGMLDDAGTFAGGAAQEIAEETGLKVKAEDLLDLTALALGTSSAANGEQLQAGTYPSPGGCDEFVPIFLYQKRLPRKALEDFQGRLTGLCSEGERITLKVVPLKHLWQHGARDAKALSAYALYTGLKQEGKI